MTKLLVFGAGENARKLIRCFNKNAEIVAFIDNDSSRWGEKMSGKNIISPDKIDQMQYQFIVIAIVGYQVIARQLTELGVDETKIIAPFEFNHEKYDEWREFIQIEELIYLEMNRKIEAMALYVNNLEYELASKLRQGKIKYPKVLNWKKAVDEIVNKGKSMSRFGDGEFDLMLGKKQSFQIQNGELVARLKEIVISSLENHIVAIPDAYGDYEGRTEEFKACFRNHLGGENRFKEYRMLDMEKEYYDSFITRPYKDYLDRSGAREKFDLLKTIWDGRDLTIVEGRKTRLGVGNDLFSNAKSCIRILGPCTDAYEKYHELMGAVLKTDKKRLVLIAMGPTATVLAYDLARQGYQALDIGHIDIEYEWFLRGVQEMVAIDGKYVNEVPGGRNVPDYLGNETYHSEIIETVV